MSVAGGTGEDYSTCTSFAAVSRPTTRGFARVWQGVTDVFQRSMDACLLSTTWQFRYVSARSLSATRERTARFVPQGFAPDLLRSLRRECTPAPRRVARIALAP
ncbi:MAG: hypothetical protein JWM10_1897 [Myxococcaceae bacterium]|nr:hypothetical protein [Myxococcaceae bacterium]